MTKPKRIKKYTIKAKEGQRLGQIIVNAIYHKHLMEGRLKSGINNSINYHADLFYIEDQDFIKALEEYAKRK